MPTLRILLVPSILLAAVTLDAVSRRRLERSGR